MSVRKATNRNCGVEYFHVGLNEWLLSGKKFTTQNMAERHRSSLIRHRYGRRLVRVKKLRV